jgi:hypothetical protein
MNKQLEAKPKEMNERFNRLETKTRQLAHELTETTNENTRNGRFPLRQNRQHERKIRNLYRQL